MKQICISDASCLKDVSMGFSSLLTQLAIHDGANQKRWRVEVDKGSWIMDFNNFVMAGKFPDSRLNMNLRNNK